MRVGVVGAGLAGLAAAGELAGAGHRVVVVEKSRGLGGRLASRRVGETVLDHGGPAIAAPPGSDLRAAIEALPAPDMTEIDDGVVYASGATRLPKLLAQGLDVRLGVRLTALREHALLDASDEAVLDRALPALGDALGPGGGEPAWVQVKRWRYAVPRAHLKAALVNPPGSRIVIAGDTVTGVAFGWSDHHRVFAGGLLAARRVVASDLPVAS